MDDDEFIEVTGRIRRRDDEGNEITEEDFGPGGARRPDGTIIFMVQGLREVPEPGPADVQPGPRFSAGARSMGREIAHHVAVNVAQVAADALADWFVERAVPAMTEKWRARRRRAADSENAKVTDVSADEAATTVSMTAEQWSSGFGMWLGAAAFEERLRTILTRAQIDNGDPEVIELQAAFATLPPEQRVEAANRVLELQTTPLDELSMTKLLGDILVIEGRAIPPRSGPPGG